MRPGRKAVARTFALAAGAGALWLAAGVATAQPSSAPPPLPSGKPATAVAPSPAAPRTTIQLTPAERQSIDAAQTGKRGAAPAGDGLVPTDEDMKARPDDDTSGTTRIEQKHQSNRISEVIVTPAGQSRSYVMTNREGRQPYGEFQTNPGLSVPMFLRFEFGKPTPPTTTPPPPSPSPSR